MFEKIVSLIERAVVALEKLASGAFVPEAQPAPEAPAKATRTRKQPEAAPPPADEGDDFLGDAPAAKTYERADVKQALQEYGKKHGMDKAQALFQSASGVKALSDLPIEKFAAVIEATKK
jgi:hypothetical protein